MKLGIECNRIMKKVLENKRSLQLVHLKEMEESSWTSKSSMLEASSNLAAERNRKTWSKVIRSGRAQRQ